MSFFPLIFFFLLAVTSFKDNSFLKESWKLFSDLLPKRYSLQQNWGFTFKWAISVWCNAHYSTVEKHIPPSCRFRQVRKVAIQSSQLRSELPQPQGWPSDQSPIPTDNVFHFSLSHYFKKTIFKNVLPLEKTPCNFFLTEVCSRCTSAVLFGEGRCWGSGLTWTLVIYSLPGLFCSNYIAGNLISTH